MITVERELKFFILDLIKEPLWENKLRSSCFEKNETTLCYQADFPVSKAQNYMMCVLRTKELLTLGQHFWKSEYVAAKD